MFHSHSSVRGEILSISGMELVQETYCLRKEIPALFCSVSLILSNPSHLKSYFFSVPFSDFTFEQNPQNAFLKQVYMAFHLLSFKTCCIYIANCLISILDKFHIYMCFSKN